MDNHKKGIITALFSGMTWGLDGVVVGLALALQPFVAHPSALAAPIAGAALHDGISMLFIMSYLICTKNYRHPISALTTKSGRLICIGALLGGPVGMTAYVVAIMRAGPAYALPVAATYPVFGALAAVVFLKEKISPSAWAGIFISVAGAAVVSASGAASKAGGFNSGIAFAAIAAACWGAEGVIASFSMDEIPPLSAITIRQLTSFIAYALVVVPATFAMPLIAGAASNPSAALLMIAAGLCGALSMTSWYKAINLSGVGTAMPLNLTFAVWAVIFGCALGTDKLSPGLVAGALLVASGAWLVASSKRVPSNL